MSPDGFQIRVCKGPVCAGQRHADAVHEEFVAAIERRSLDGRIQLERQNCFGRCQRGPNVYVRQRPGHAGHRRRVRSALYNGVGNGGPRDIATDVDEILASHVLAGELVTRLIQKPDAAEVDADIAAELEKLQELEERDDGADELQDAQEARANPAGGDPLGTGADVRLAVTMRSLPDAGDEPQADTPGETRKQTSNRDMMENG